MNLLRYIAGYVGWVMTILGLLVIVMVPANEVSKKTYVVITGSVILGPLLVLANLHILFFPT